MKDIVFGVLNIVFGFLGFIYLLWRKRNNNNNNIWDLSILIKGLLGALLLIVIGVYILMNNKNSQYIKSKSEFNYEVR